VELALRVLLILSSLTIVLLILLHRGKGGGLSNLFGGGVSSSLGGSSTVERNLDRFTIAAIILWTVSIVGLGLLARG
jgi:preprotein translocase subunit SecG